MPLLLEKLRILTFPQRIDGNQLDLHVLLIPTQRLLNVLTPFNSLLNPGNSVKLPSFIAANLKLGATVIKGLSSYPFSDPNSLGNEATLEPFPTTLAFPPNLPALYEGLAAQFEIKDTGAVTTNGAGDPWDEGDGLRKYLPVSYRTAFNFTIPRTQYAKTDDSYQCAIKRAPQPKVPFPPSPETITWGQVIAFCLRQPLLLERIGLLHKLTLTLPAADYFQDGGWVYFDLTSNKTEFDIFSPATELKLYAARIPPIAEKRQVFAALLFPVVPGPFQPTGDFDTLKIEVADYDDGFAKIVHTAQPVSANLLSEEPDGIHVQKDVGIRLGWDDEQLLIWQNRQVLADPATPGKRTDAPLGVYTYRVDVKKSNEDKWNSLVIVRNKAELTLAGQHIANAGLRIETGVQVYPTKINAANDTLYWLPSYFTQWYGPSLVLPDTRAALLDESGALAKPGDYEDANIKKNPGQVGGLYEPLLPENLELKYGGQYDFRVRLADLTGGGPRLEELELNDAPARSSSIIFKRFVAPKQLKVTSLSPQPAPDSGTVVFYQGNSFEIARPRLGYPALLFTEMDTQVAFQKLLDDKAFLHTGKIPNKETIKEQREVSYFDPDVDKMMVIVELRTLLLDNLASLNQREAFIPLYTTFRNFSADPEEPFTLELEYRDANVIEFDDEIDADLGDLNLSKTDINNNDNPIVLPTSRDVRITLLPVCSEKEDSLEYFGFAETLFAGEFVRTGEPVQFFVRQNATEEQEFFRQDLESRQLQGIYLQPDPPQVINALTIVAEVVEGKELEQSTLMQRLASQLDLDFKGLTLIGKPGERIQFGCSNRIRHTLAPDNSSLTFATKGDLFNHWLCVLSFEINRDWTWDGMSETGIEIIRDKQFTGEDDTNENEIVGYVRLIRTASRTATDGPDRSLTRIVFIDAVEPKKDLDKPTTQARPFPNTIDAQYTLIPNFIPAVSNDSVVNESVMRDLQLPVTTIPAQVLKVVAAGIALSPYRHSEDYSETTVRQRYLWFEFKEPVQDPNDTCFARVLTYAPDPLLSYANPDQLLVIQKDPPLAIDPELIRVITKDHGNDNAGINAMQMMEPETGEPVSPMIPFSPVHYLLPLPPGLHNESGELFGFFTYELRVGHTDRIWSTAHGRFGHPTRVNGVQHPAPPLKCLVDRTPDGITVTAQYAQALFNGKNVTSKPPKTEIWCMLYAQVKQADGKQTRNILLSEDKLQYTQPKKNLNLESFLAQRSLMPIKNANSIMVNIDAPSTGIAGWTENEISQLLKQFNLAGDTGLSVLAVEMMPRYDQYIFAGPTPDTFIHPLSQELGQYRILRTSRLVAAPEICCEDCP
ncbi:MAG: hypothetical protein QOH25_2472 [Acidobacteriota bacterium]|jgi:hypothetical protein|nr:hypothetical protein [Acidobacteriota bacterium]